MDQDHYQTLGGRSIGEYKDRGSKFLAYAFPLSEEKDISDALSMIKKEHPKARHHCFAYRLGLDGSNFRVNDDGEPSGTAGWPILRQIDRNGLTNVMVIVVRYFGGTKLGTSGLIKAYKESTSDAIDQAEIITKRIENFFQLSFGYELMSDVMNAVKKLQARIVKQEFEDKGLLIIAFPRSEAQQSVVRLKAYIKKVSLEEAETIDEISGLELSRVDI